jgi:Ca2+-transporting ATPase
LVLFPAARTSAAIAALIAGFVQEHSPGDGFDPPEGQTNDDRFPPGYETRQGKVSRRKLRKLIGGVERQPEKPWHLQSAEEVMAFFGTSADRGLPLPLVSHNLSLYGPNVLPESVPRSGWRIFFGQLRSLPVYMLGCSALVSLLTGGVADAVVILAVVGINAAIGYVTESQAEMTIHSLKRLVRPSALTIREGNTLEIRAEVVVTGDLLVFRPGSYIPADCRIVEAQQMTVDESALTGESLPVVKTTETLSGKEVLLADRVNMGYMGTLVTGGQGLGVVVGTGRFTELGEVHSLVEGAETPKTPMERELERIGNQLVWLSSAVCGGVFLVGLLRGYGMLQMFKSAITLGVAAIPEGLPAVATTVLALGIRKMKGHHVLIRRLDAVETLGCLQTVCLDKTGTITLNRMTVVEIQAGLNSITISEGKCWIEQGPVTCRDLTELGSLLRIGALCSETEIAGKEVGYVLHGSSTENALVELALEQGIDVVRLRQQYPLRQMTHRTETRPHMSTLHEASLTEEADSDYLADAFAEKPGRLVAVKGSPSEVLQMCTWQLRDGRRAPLSEPGRQAIELENERMAGNGLRVLGLAFCRIGAESPEGPADHGLVWLGLIGMADPIRNGLKELIDRFHRAHIDTVMITGDQVPTAYAIGRELGLQRVGQLEIFESTRLREIDPEVLATLAKRAQIFARVSPAQKLQIVRAFQRAGKVVAMTGDGINDGPALKAADIGVAMGGSGTDVAREVANVVLEDDNLETLVVAIGHGRSIYGNIRKSVRFLLSTNMSEIMVMLAAITAGLGQPLTPIQLLWINLLSDIFPGLALSLEEPEPDVLERPPRNPQDPIISKADFRRLAFESTSISAGAMTAYGYGIARYGMGARAGTLAFTSLTVGQLLHCLSCRSERISFFSQEKLPPNPYLHLALGGSLLLQALAMLVPGLRGMLGITPSGLLDGAVIGGSAVLPLLVNEATKEERKRRAP